MLNRDIIQIIQEEFNKGVPSDDTRLSNRFIYNKALSVRNLLLMQKVNSKQSITIEDTSTLCVDMIDVNGVDCCGYTGTCNVIRSKEKIPSIVQSIYGPLIKSISGPNFKRKISLIDESQIPYLSGMRYSSSVAKYFIADDYLYLIGKDVPRKIRLMAVFENPLDVLNCNAEDSCKSYLDLDFKLQGGLTDSLIQIVSEQLLKTFMQVKEDKINNSTDD